MIYADLESWATPRQLEIIEAVRKHGSHTKAAESLGINRRVLDRSIKALKQRAARSGHSPEHGWTRTVPDGFKLHGLTQWHPDTKQWTKASIDKDRQAEIMQAAAEALATDVPRAKPIKAPTETASQLCNVYTLTDSHVGMLAWGDETGADWDLDIAERTLTGCFEALVLGAQRAETAVVAQLGDFLHFDSLQAITPTSGHLLDADSRFQKVVQSAVRILRRVVDVALMHHQRVIVLMAEGNHDMASSVWLRTLFAALYEREPRVTVINDPLPYYVHQHGDVMLAWHHGHLKKNDQLPLLFASQFPRVWGSTVKRYAHTGHRHHLEIKEHSGMTVVQHSTLAARDAYAARGGWMSEREATAYTYHAKRGCVASVTVSPEMLTE